MVYLSFKGFGSIYKINKLYLNNGYMIQKVINFPQEEDTFSKNVENC